MCGFSKYCIDIYTRGPSTSAGNHENEEDEGKCNKVKPKFV